MTRIAALLEHFHPKFKGAVSGAGLGAAVVAGAIALGLDLTEAEKDAIVFVVTTAVTYIVPSSSE
jgi:hypothetical protein